MSKKSFPGELSAPVQQLKRSIQDNYSDSGYRLQHSFDLLSFHHDYLRRLFKQEVGISPLMYLTKLRMEKAKELLSDPKNKTLPIVVLAQQCGYDDPLYFSRVFKKTYGCSPSQYKQQV